MHVCLLLVWLTHHCLKKKMKICNVLHSPCQPSLKTMLWWSVSSMSSNNLYNQAIQGKMVWLHQGVVLCLDTGEYGCSLSPQADWHQALLQSQARIECCWNLKWAKAHQCLLMWSAFMNRFYWFRCFSVSISILDILAAIFFKFRMCEILFCWLLKVCYSQVVK